MKGTLCEGEEAYVMNRRPVISTSIREYLDSLTLVQYQKDILKIIADQPPILGLAISGGGYRSMLTGTGYIQEMKKYGIFSSLSYISGLSGGSWILMDLVVNDFDIDVMPHNWNLSEPLLQGIPNMDFKQTDLISGMNRDESASTGESDTRFDVIDDLLVEASGYISHSFDNTGDFDGKINTCKRNFNPFKGVGKILFSDDFKSTPVDETTVQLHSLANLHQILKFYIKLHLEVRPKRYNGFRVSFTDYLGKALLNCFKYDKTSNLNTTSFSELMKQSVHFSNYSAPIPIFVTNCKNRSLRNIIFEFTPFEFGSWEPLIRLFVKMSFLGSKVRQGIMYQCVNGFDDIGFITASSSSIFNNVVIYAWKLMAESSKETIRAIKSILSIFGLTQLEFDARKTVFEQPNTEYAVIQPNPFYKYPEMDPAITTDDYLYLVDGGEDGENIPLRPLTIPERNLDVIFIIDSSSDVNNYATGAKLKNVFKWMKNGEKYMITKKDKKLKKSIVFGCYQESIPLIIYQANTKHSYSSNTSTFKITYNDPEITSMLQNGRDIFNYDGDEYYKNCLSCFILKKTIDNNDEVDFPKFCSGCFDEYCY